MQEEENNNPYQVIAAPEAAPAAASSTPQAAPQPPQPPLSQGPVLRAEPAKLPWRHGWLWLVQAWVLFKAKPGTWIGMILGYVLAYVLPYIAAALIPFSQLTLGLFVPVMTAGFVLGAYSLDEGQDLRFGHLWSGFQHKNKGQLISVGAITILALMVITLAMVLVALGLIAAGYLVSADFWSVLIPYIYLGPLYISLMLSLLMLPLMMALWFAPALVVLNDVPALEAMKLSFKACWRNMGAFTIYGLIMLVLVLLVVFVLFLAALALNTIGLDLYARLMTLTLTVFLLGIGIVLLMYISYYTSYRDVLTEG